MSKEVMVTMDAYEAQQRWFALLRQVVADHEPVRITSKAGDAVLMSAKDYDSWQETVHLLSSFANAGRLMAAVARDKANPRSLPTANLMREEIANRR